MKSAMTISLSTAVMVACLTAGFATAQSPDICAPVERLDKYRYLRQLTLDLYGRIPSVEEYERLHTMDDVSNEMVDEMIGSLEFYAQLRRYHRNLLWSNLGVYRSRRSGHPRGRRRHLPRLGQPGQARRVQAP